MLNISLSKIYKLIELADIRLQYYNSQPKSSSRFGDILEKYINKLEEGISADEEIQLSQYLYKLSKEELYEVIALFDLGREGGSFSTHLKRWEGHEDLEYLRKRLDGKADLGSDLRKGLEASGIDYEP